MIRERLPADVRLYGNGRADYCRWAKPLSVDTLARELRCIVRADRDADRQGRMFSSLAIHKLLAPRPRRRRRKPRPARAAIVAPPPAALEVQAPQIQRPVVLWTASKLGQGIWLGPPLDLTDYAGRMTVGAAALPVPGSSGTLWISLETASDPGFRMAVEVGKFEPVGSPSYHCELELPLGRFLRARLEVYGERAAFHCSVVAIAVLR